jgi:phage baseplate assembly protein W
LATEYKYSDLDLDFTANPITKDISLKYDVEAVKRSLRNLIFTKKNERFFRPDISGGIHDLLFENFGSIQTVTIRSRIENLIQNYEPRVTEAKIELYEKREQNALQIDIYFRVRNIPGMQELTLDLQRVR